MRIHWRESFHYDWKIHVSVEEQYSVRDTESKVYATILGGGQTQGVLGNAKITNTCGYINIT